MRMAFLGYGVLLSLSAFAACRADESAAALHEGEAVINALRSVDGLYDAALSLSGTERVGRELLRPGDPGGTYQWRYTRNADEIVLHTVRVDGGDPEYVAPGESTFADYDDEGNMIARLLSEELHHFAPNERFRLQRYRQCHISSEGSVTHEEICDVVAFFGPADDEPTLPIKRALWSMGRGFAPYLQDVVACSRREDGAWEIEARGFESPVSQGRWQLTIDPSRSFLVIAASYTRDGREEPTITLGNLGNQGAGPCSVAENADWAVNLGYVSERRHECSTAAFRTDEELLEVGRKAKRGPFPASALALDKRSGSYKALDGQRMRRPRTETAIAPSSRVSYFLWLFAAHLLVGLMALGAYRSSVRKRSTANRPGGAS